MQEAISTTANEEFIHNVICENFSGLKEGDINMMKMLRTEEQSGELLVTFGSSYIYSSGICLKSSNSKPFVID